MAISLQQEIERLINELDERCHPEKTRVTNCSELEVNKCRFPRRVKTQRTRAGRDARFTLDSGHDTKGCTGKASQQLQTGHTVDPS